MRYKEMIEQAKAKGLASEKTMWESIEDIDEMLCAMKAEHPDKYWRFMRKQHGVMYANHYDETWARHDVSHMKPLGEHWSVAQTNEVTKGMVKTNGANEWDIYVALNAFANDLHNVLNEELIVQAAIAFFFVDEDFEGGGKIWRYMCMVHK